MFRRRATGKYRTDQPTLREVSLARDVRRLRRDIARLERALGEVIEASDDVLVDLNSHEAELQRLTSRRFRSTGFAHAWTHYTPAAGSTAGSSFFDIGHVDKRARRWLLTKK